MRARILSSTPFLTPARRALARGLILLCALAGSASAASAGVVYVSRPSDAFGTVDLSTGVYTAIGTTAVQLDALTFAPSGVLYGIGSDNKLYEVNTATAGLTLVGPAGSFFNLVALASRSDGAFFASDTFSNGPGGFEYRVNPATGMATTLGQSGLSGGFVDSGGLAFGPGDVLYMDYGSGASTNALYTVNQSTGLATKLGNTGVAADGLVFSGGQAFGFDFFGEIYRFDPTTGAATDTHLAVTGGFGPIDAAAAAPEPASLLLLLVGFFAVVCYTRRQIGRGLWSRLSGLFLALPGIPPR
jgi:hypothetical protein